MKKTKTQKGITLVALIITIVVLLILAVVAIGAVRNSDIIGHAQNAAGSYNQAKNNEINLISGYEELLDELISSSKIEYYILEDESEIYRIIKFDYDNLKFISCIFEDGANQKIETPCDGLGENIIEETIITVDNLDGTTSTEHMNGAKPILIGGATAAYLKENKLYGPGVSGYYCYELVTEASKLAEIERLIATLN